LRAANELLSPNSSEKTILRLAEWIQSSELLERLRNSQYLLDRKGVLEADPNDENFLACMTLRDCTLYLRMPDDEMKKEFEARIGDLDLKSPDKAEYWKSVERPLIEEGWYLGLEPEEDWQPLTCHLSPERWDPMKGQRRNTD
jgi:inositol-pentakisphosphate 2-kinase